MLLHAVLASQQLDDAPLAEDAGGGDTEDMATDAGATIAAGQGGGDRDASRRHCSSGIGELGKLRTEEKDRCRLLNARQTIGSELISAESLPRSAHRKTAEEAPDSQRMLQLWQAINSMMLVPYRAWRYSYGHIVDRFCWQRTLRQSIEVLIRRYSSDYIALTTG